MEREGIEKGESGGSGPTDGEDGGVGANPGVDLVGAGDCKRAPRRSLDASYLLYPCKLGNITTFATAK